jgi:hypothetical protein
MFSPTSSVSLNNLPVNLHVKKKCLLVRQLPIQLWGEDFTRYATHLIPVTVYVIQSWGINTRISSSVASGTAQFIVFMNTYTDADKTCISRCLLTYSHMQSSQVRYHNLNLWSPTGSTRHGGHWLAYCSLPRVIMMMENLVEWRLAGENEVLGEHPPQRHFVHHKSHLTRPGIEPGPPRREASD